MCIVCVHIGYKKPKANDLNLYDIFKCCVYAYVCVRIVYCAFLQLQLRTDMPNF